MILKAYHKAITHMRQKKEDKELIMCLGAGINKFWNLPNWWELVRDISENKDVNGKSIFESNMSLTTKTQTLYEHYKKNCSIKQKDLDCIFQEDFVRHEWIKIIHHELYKKCKKKNSRQNHPYINEFINIIEQSPITINYNFDDFIEQRISKRQKNDSGERNYETIYSPSVNFKRSQGVIYHPNGFLPESLAEGYSDHFIFAEKSFQDQLLESIMGYYSPLLYFFSKYTMLFLGLSMEDQTLRHLLRQNAIINPGHCHYYVFFKDRNFNLTADEMKAIQDSYFDTFNLIVLFFDNNEIAELGKYLNMELSKFEDESNARDAGISYNYYITGAPGTGKTTVLNYLGSFNIFNEWPDARPDNLNKEDNFLSSDERKRLDEWIQEQFRKKNKLISKNSLTKCCIQLIDRSPLDPITYAETKHKIAERARSLKSTYFKNKRDKELSPGHIILFTADPECVFRRLNKRNPKQYSKTWIKQKLEQFNGLYDLKDVTVIDTTSLNISEVVKKLLYEVCFGRYNEIVLESYLKKYCGNEREIYFIE